ncbi:MAG TPA: LysM peptidoglycan-binding domain-containing protein [Chloroflexi bacterium]|nr:LysM peptidoglycan-binding domain-containing protein [Chloroflexota bacterium]
MKPGPLQQAITGLVIFLAVAATLAGGIILALSDSASPSAGAAATTPSPTATTYRIPTLPSGATEEASPLPSLPPATITPTHTPVSTSTPIPTATRAITVTPPPADTACRVRSGWVSYVVRPGENLFRIGLRYGQTVNEMMAANCLTDPTIEAGDVIYVPPVTPVALPTATATPTPGALPDGLTPTPTGTQTATDGACTNYDSIITSPPVGAVLSGVVEFYGTARIPDFSFYKLEIREEGVSTSADYVTFFTGYEPVVDGLLTTLDTRAWPDGQYWIRLVVVNSTGNYPERCAILYIIDN